MSSILPLYIQNEKQWYFISIFYARENWKVLIAEIEHFYQKMQSQFCNCLISFSGEKGEHLQLTFATLANDINNYIDEIQVYFQLFIDQNPSVGKIPFPYGKAVWGNYSNNSIAWYRFKLPNYSDQYINFHQQTMDIALKLLADDFSEDAIFSVGMYLITKALCYIENKEQKSILSQALDDASGASPHFVYTAKELVNKIDINEIGEIIESYWNEDTNNFSLELVYWLNEVKNLLNLYNFNNLCTFICEIMGLKGLRQLMILELMNIWYNKKK